MLFPPSASASMDGRRGAGVGAADGGAAIGPIGASSIGVGIPFAAVLARLVCVARGEEASGDETIPEGALAGTGTEADSADAAEPVLAALVGGSKPT